MEKNPMNTLMTKSNTSAAGFRKTILPLILGLCATACHHGNAEKMEILPEPIAIPDSIHLVWQDMEMNMFCHFGPNTFTGKEWGDGKESPSVFMPTDLDCRQWARTARLAGCKGIVFTAKHHDGFCLWPNPESRHTVRESPWRDGKGDVLRELSDACKAEGIKLGIYLSPWDQNDPRYFTPAYDGAYRRAMQHALTQYGPVFEEWFDAAYKDFSGPTYDWDSFFGDVHKLQKDAIVFTPDPAYLYNIRPGCRWVGNEQGKCGGTSWSAYCPEQHQVAPNTPADLASFGTGDAFGQYWMPSETNVSIRPGWFWRESENNQVKSLQQLLKIYHESVGYNSLLLLNVPPDSRGRIHETDSLRLMELRAALDSIYGHDLASGGALCSDSKGTWTLKLPNDTPARFNRIVLQEDITRGQRIAEFVVEAKTWGRWKEVARGTTVGRKRILTLPKWQKASRLRVRVRKSLGMPTLKSISLHEDNIYQYEPEKE